MARLQRPGRAHRTAAAVSRSWLQPPGLPFARRRSVALPRAVRRPDSPEDSQAVGIKTWVVVLVKDFDSAKERLRPALGTRSRRTLARRNAHLAVAAAAAGDHLLV